MEIGEELQKILNRIMQGIVSVITSALMYGMYLPPKVDNALLSTLLLPQNCKIHLEQVLLYDINRQIRTQSLTKYSNKTYTTIFSQSAPML